MCIKGIYCLFPITTEFVRALYYIMELLRVYQARELLNFEMQRNKNKKNNPLVICLIKV